MYAARYVLRTLLAGLLVSGAAFAQTSLNFIDAQDFASDGEAGVESPALSESSVATTSGAKRPNSCDLRDAVPIAPFPYCGGSGGLTLRTGSEDSPGLLGFLTYAGGYEDIVWLNVDDPTREIGRCNPDDLRLIRGMAYNDGSLGGSSDTLFVANYSRGSQWIVEIGASVGTETSDRSCSPDDPGDARLADAENCGVLREFRIPELEDRGPISALALAESPAFDRTVLVASSTHKLFFLAPPSPSADFLRVIHECQLDESAGGVAWLGEDRFLVAYGSTGRLDVLDNAGRACEITGSFHAPGLGQVGGATYDRDQGLLFVSESGGDEMYAVSLEPDDRDPVAIAEPDAIEECIVGGTFVLDGRGSCDPDEDPRALIYTWTAPDGEQFDGSTVRINRPPVGTYSYELRIDDGRGNFDTDRHDIEVIDSRSPRIAGLSASPAELWPPDRHLVPVTVEVYVDEACDPEPRCVIVDVESSDPARGVEPDWEFRSDLVVALRAERDGQGDRTYTLTVECRDESGNASSSTTEVRVPHHDLGVTCACWSRDELKSISPNPDTETWFQTCKRGDDVRPDVDWIQRTRGRLGHIARAESGSDVGEYFCQYAASIPNLPWVNRYRYIDEQAYELCRDQVRRRQQVLGIADQCTTN